MFYWENGWSCETAQGRQEAVDALAAIEDPIGDEEDSDDNEEMDEAPVLVSQRRVRSLALAPSLALDPGMWLNTVNVKPQYLANLKIERWINLFWIINGAI